jgi:hypothetical protein
VVLSKEYIAGLIDGEGCIGIYEYNNRHSFSFRVQLKGCFPRELIELLKREYGGSIFQGKQKNPKHRDFTQWAVISKYAVRFIQELLPHMIIKKEEAKLFLEAWEYYHSLPCHGNKGRQEEELIQMRYYVDILKGLKRGQ